MTHRKNDYGTILGLLKSVKPSTSKNLISLNEAHDVPREVGRWFVVEASERNVVRLGIGANPGLKKYYWRANGSKRLLKREMEDNSEPADLVYIIQKAETVSKRCASIPGTDHWLVMYLPSTLRSKNSPKKTAGATTFSSSSQAKNSSAGAGPTRKRKRSAPTRRPQTNVSASRDTVLQKKTIASKTFTSKKSVGPTSRKAALRKTSSLPPFKSSGSIKLSSSAVANIIKTTTSSKTSAGTRKTNSTTTTLIQRNKTRPQKRTKRRNSLLTLFKLSEPFSIKSTISSSDDELNQLISESFDSDYSSDEEIDVVHVDDEQIEKKQQSKKTRQIRKQSQKSQSSSSSSSSAVKYSMNDDKKSVGPSQRRNLKKQKRSVNTSPARGCQEYSLFGSESELFFNPCWSAPPPTISKVSDPDPFLPLAGSQTSFSAVIEAAAMSGSFLPSSCGFDNFSRLSVSPPTQSVFPSF